MQNRLWPRAPKNWGSSNFFRFSYFFPATCAERHVKMGETLIYSQRLHGINEKRRILSEVDRIQRELEQQRLKLQQLKRKSLRDRWLMDGLVSSSPGAETDNPFSETEGEIRSLELQLENLQSELVYLENPELKLLKGTKVQAKALQNDLVNGDGNQQQVDQNENYNESTIQEDDQLADGHEEDPEGSTVSSSPLRIEESLDHLDPSDHDHREKNLELELSKEIDQLQPIQDGGSCDKKEFDGDHKSSSQENYLLNVEHRQELQNVKEEHTKQDATTQGNDCDDHVDKVQSLPFEKLHSLENSLETKEQDMRNLSKELGHDSVNVDLQPSPGIADLGDSLVNQDENNKESLLDEITKLVNQTESTRKENELSTIEEHGQESTVTVVDEVNAKNDEEANVPVSVSYEQGNNPDGEIVSTLDNKRPERNLLNAEGPTDKPAVVSLKFDWTESSDQNSELVGKALAPLPLHQNSALPPTDQDERITLPCQDQVPSPSLPFEGQNQVQTPLFLVVSSPGLDLNSQQDPSAIRKPESSGTSTPPESQPLLQKPLETDGHRETNTAETRDKGTLEKKKTCHCCMVM